jgi:uncharacterized protein YdhG (YjbR/CyaY superfamily)
MTAKPETIDAYIAAFPPETQEALQLVRKTVLEVAPEAGEKISYDMPTMTLNGTYLVYFAAFAKHIGLYSVPTENPHFEEAFAPYKTGRGSIQFPLNKPMPVELIKRIVEFNVERVDIVKGL